MQTVQAFRPERGGQFLALRAELPLVSEGSAKTWIHIAVEGTWEGHGFGAFTFTREIFETIKANFDRALNPIPLTYGHPDGETAARDGAAGWIHDLEIREDGLWAFTEFTDRSAAQVRAGEHRFCSVVVAFESVDRVTGEETGPELYEVGLVLSPFLSELTPIELSRRGSFPTRSLSMPTLEDKLAKIRELFGLPEGADIDQINAVIAAEQSLEEARAERKADKEEVKVDPTPETNDAPAVDIAASAETEASTVALMDEELPQGGEADSDDVDAMAGKAIMRIAEEAGVSVPEAIAFFEQHAEELSALIADQLAGEGDPERPTPEDAPLSREANSNSVSASDTRVEAAEARVAALSARLEDRDETILSLQKRLAEAEAASDARDIDDAIECGAILPAHRDIFVRLSKSDRSAFRDELEKAKSTPAVPTGQRYKPRHSPEGTPANTVDLSDGAARIYAEATAKINGRK